MSKLHQLLVLVTMLTFFSGCGKKAADTSEQEAQESQTAPMSPPSTLSLDVDLADNAAGANLNSDETQLSAATKLNAFQAGIIVAVWNTYLSVLLGVPALALAAALKVEPTHDATTDTWTWSTAADSAGKTFGLDLKGTPISAGTGANWVLTVNNEGGSTTSCCKDFDWIEGTTTGTGTGNWKLRNPAKPAEDGIAIQVDWTATSASARLLTITNTATGTEDNNYGKGSTLKYNVAGEIVTVTIFNSAKSETIIIESNRTDKSGSLTKSDGTIHCWDGDRFDIDCPA